MTYKVNAVEYAADRLVDSIESSDINTEEQWNKWLEARAESFEVQIEQELAEMEMDA